MTEQSKKIVIIIGAGATIPWGGKITKDLTNDLIESCQFYTNNKENYLKFLQHNLASFYHQRFSDINFELILSSIERLFEYYLYQESNKILNYTPDWVSLFTLFDTIEKEFPEITADTTRWVEKTLCDYYYANNQHLEKDKVQKGFPKSNFYRKLYLKTVNDIRESVYEYSKKTNYNENLKSFFEYIKEQKKILRIYSTNYDNLSNECSPNGKKFFNGFDMVEREKKISEVHESKEVGVFNINKTLNDENCDCFYNLHGSVNYDISFKYRDIDRDNEIVFLDDPYRFSIKPTQVEVLLDNTIISGQQKIIRTSLEPYSSFIQSFKKDCLNAELLLCIGVSFSDSYINNIIKQAWKVNPNFKFSSIGLNKKINKNNFTEILPNADKVCPDKKCHVLRLNNNQDNWWTSNNNSVKIFVDGFNSFLDNNTNWEIIKT